MSKKNSEGIKLFCDGEEYAKDSVILFLKVLEILGGVVVFGFLFLDSIIILPLHLFPYGLIIMYFGSTWRDI